MPIRSDWKLAREGPNGDTFARLLKYTAFNPALTLPLVLLARYTSQGSQIASQHGTALRNIKTLAALGVLGAVSNWLDNNLLNNFKSDVYDWNKEVVVVTGGADGIGKLVVKLLAERGVKVAVLDVQELTYEAPPTVRYFHCDLASTKSIETAASSIKSAFGNPTVLINNAGCARGKTILDATEFDIRLTFNVNTLSHYFLAHQFLPSMIENNHGMVVTVASLAAYATGPSMVDYAASKVAALAFHEGLSAELSSVYKADKVRTVALCQGYTRTALFEGFDPQGALHTATVAEAIVKAVLKGKSAHVILPLTTGTILPFVRGWPAWMQYKVRTRMVKLMSNWKGRQVVQPSEQKTGEDQGKDVEGSTVLVEGN